MELCKRLGPCVDACIAAVRSVKGASIAESRFSPLRSRGIMGRTGFSVGCWRARMRYGKELQRL